MSHEAQTFDSVEKMVEGLWGQDAFAETVKQRIAQRRIVSTLQAMRVARNIPQSRIAEALQCTQSRVSKIENCDDAELTLKELEAYARVFDCDLNLLFSSRKMTAVDRVQYHAFAIKRELEQMADCAQGDHQIARGVADFYREAFINFIKMIQEAASQLPNQPENGKPYIHISTAETSSAAATEEVAPQPVAKIKMKRSRKREPRVPAHA